MLLRSAAGESHLDMEYAGTRYHILCQHNTHVDLLKNDGDRIDCEVFHLGDGTDTMNISGALTVLSTINGETIASLSGATVVNSTHSAGDGSDHADVATSTADIITVSGARVVNTNDITSLSGVVVVVDDDLTSLSGVCATHTADSSDPHGATLTQANIISSGTISGANINLTGDKSGGLSGMATVVNTIFGTGATPPTASGFPVGTVYLQHAA